MMGVTELAVGAVGAQHAVHVVEHGAEGRVVGGGEAHGGVAALHGAHEEAHLAQRHLHKPPQPARHHRP